MKNSILKSAVISEKSFKDASNSKFTFIVDKKATKDDIKLACESILSVDVLGVNIASYTGKVKKTKTGLGKRNDYKKAIVTVKTGQKIDLFEIETEEDKKNKKADKTKDSNTASK